MNKDFVSGWLDFFNSESRLSAFVDKDSSVLSTIEQSLSKYLFDTQKSAYPIGSSLRFYTAEVTEVSVFNVKPFIFEAYLFVAVVAYLAAFGAFVKFDVLSLVFGGR